MIKGIKQLTLHDSLDGRILKVDIQDNGDVYIPSIDFKIPAKEIVSLAFFVAKPEFQDHLVHTYEQIVRPYKKQHVVRVKQAMKKGEEIVVNCEVNIPLMVENKIKEELQKDAT